MGICGFRRYIHKYATFQSQKRQITFVIGTTNMNS